MMALSAGKIASSIASGSASFSGADAIRGGMQLTSTAAAGAGAVVAGKALLGTAGGNALGDAAKRAASSMPSAYDAGRSMGNAVGEALHGKPELGVSPSGGSGFGQPIDSRPAFASPGGESSSPAAPASTSSPSGSEAPAGDARTAGISGGGNTKPSSDGRNRSFGEKVQDAAQAQSQDTHAVSIQMHVGKD